MKKIGSAAKLATCLLIAVSVVAAPFAAEASHKSKKKIEAVSVSSKKSDIIEMLKPSAPKKTSQSTARYDSNPKILGNAVATEEQCVKYLLSVNPNPKINGKPQELVKSYYKEGTLNGVRPDIAFAQALHETGFFRYGGSVKPWQNNFCGLGSVNAKAGGANFSDIQTGVKAHIQHIMAYSTTARPQGSIVDPRYDVVKKTSNFASAQYWTDLNGKWAVPGHGYGEKILSIYNSILLE
jgi:Ni/Co efflux regulator RcnB